MLPYVSEDTKIEVMQFSNDKSQGIERQSFEVTEKTENPTDDIIPKISPTKEFSLLFPKAIITIPIVAIAIDIQTFKEICSFKNILATNGCIRGKVLIIATPLTGLVNKSPT